MQMHKFFILNYIQIANQTRIKPSTHLIKNKSTFVVNWDELPGAYPYESKET